MGIIDCCNDCPLQDFFLYRPCRAVKVHLSLKNSADATPDCGFTATVVPLHAAINVSAVSAEHHIGKCILTAGKSAFAAGIQMDSSGDLRLDFHEHIFVDNSFMTAFNIVLRHLTIVGSTLLIQSADRVVFLQKGITDILLVGKDLMNIASMPFKVSRYVRNAVCFQASLNLQEACPFEVPLVDAANNHSLLRVNDLVAVSVLGVV